MEHGQYVRVSHFEQDEPGIIPAPRALHIGNDRPFRLVQALGSKRIGLCKSTQLAEEVIRVDIVRPGGGQRLRNIRSPSSDKTSLCTAKVDKRIIKTSVECAGQVGFLALKFNQSAWSSCRLLETKSSVAITEIIQEPAK